MKYISDSKINRISNSPAELNYQGVPYDNGYNYKLTNISNPFADKGAWFGYYFNDDKTLSFNGPNVISQEIPVNAAKYLSKNILIINNKRYENFNQIEFLEENGSLSIKAYLKTKNFSLTIYKRLIFCSSEDALLSIDIKGSSKIDLDIEIQSESLLYKKIKHASTNDQDSSKGWIPFLRDVKISKDEVQVHFNPLVNKNVKETLKLVFPKQITLLEEKEEKNSKRILLSLNKWVIKKLKPINISLNWYESFYFNKKFNHFDFTSKTISTLVEENNKRWKSYKVKIKKLSNKEKQLSYKALVTLIGNWLSPNGVLKTDIIIPSRTYRDFIGAYAWDSFKIAYGLSFIDQELAQKVILSMFDFQIKKNDKVRPQDEGMIPDCIFFNFAKDRGGSGTNWNERNTKPPLAAWATMKVYQNNKDIKFLERMFSKIKKYLSWWERNRTSGIANLLCYGATIDAQNSLKNPKSIIEAASWESGMDNAPRFDWDRMEITKRYHDGRLIGYTINQASICLNSFYFRECLVLSDMAKILGFKKDYLTYKSKAKDIKNTIEKYMYSSKDNFYHDISINDLKPLDNYGLSIESFIALYEKISSKERAIKCIDCLSNKNFLTNFPFPTVSADNKRFNEFDYWRGPVWISFLYFAILGIYNYVPDKGQKIKKQVVDILNQKKHINKPLRENYNPLNQDGLSTTNFSWTASMLIALIFEIKE